MIFRAVVTTAVLAVVVTSATSAESITRDQVIDAIVSGLAIEKQPPIFPFANNVKDTSPSRSLTEVQTWARHEFSVMGPELLPESLPWCKAVYRSFASACNLRVIGDLGAADQALLRLSIFDIRLASARLILSEPVAGQPGPADATSIDASLRPLHDRYVAAIARSFGMPADDVEYKRQADKFWQALSAQGPLGQPEIQPWRPISDERSLAIDTEMQAALNQLSADYAKTATDHGRLTDPGRIAEKVTFYRPIFCNRALNVWGNIARRETIDPRQQVDDESLVPGITAARKTREDLEAKALMALARPNADEPIQPSPVTPIAATKPAPIPAPATDLMPATHPANTVQAPTETAALPWRAIVAMVIGILVLMIALLVLKRRPNHD